MLPAALRLGKTPKITATLKNGRRIASQNFVLHVVTSSASESKFAFAVSKKVGNSVVRHKITRQLREIVTKNRYLVPPGSEIVVRALPKIIEADFQQLSEEFVASIKKMGGDK